MNELLVNARKKNKMSYKELANILNISESMVRKVEAGYRNPSSKLALRWSLVLNIPESKIFKYFFNQKQDNMCL